MQTCPNGTQILESVTGVEAIQASTTQPYVGPVYAQNVTGWNMNLCLMTNDIWGWT